VSQTLRRSPARAAPGALLTGQVELLPWLKQWHNEMNPQYGLGLGDFIQGFVEKEVRWNYQSTKFEIGNLLIKRYYPG
jgi:hypothetical protein